MFNSVKLTHPLPCCTETSNITKGDYKVFIKNSHPNDTSILRIVPQYKEIML